MKNRRELFRSVGAMIGMIAMPVLASSAAPVRRIFYIDVGDLPPDRARENIALFQAEFRKGQIHV